MATYGTPATTSAAANLKIGEIYDHAFRRAGVQAQLITAENLQTARSLLNFVLSDLSASGFRLWTSDNVCVGMQQGMPKVTMPSGTMSVDHVNLREATISEGSNSGSGTVVTFTADEATAAQMLGIKVDSRLVFNLTIEYSEDNVSWTEAAVTYNVELFPNKWNWIEIIPATPSVRYFRITERYSQTIPVSDVCVATLGTEVPVTAMGQDQYVYLPNKFMQGRPVQYWEDRQTDVPVLNIWPAPDETNASYHLNIYRRRHLFDVGTMTQNAEVPQRWLDYIIWDLAWRIATEIEGATTNPDSLQAQAMKARARIEPYESDSGDLNMLPDISGYTR